MKKIYLIAPLFALLVFGLGYWHEAGLRTGREAALQATAAKLRTAAQNQEAADRELAIQTALATQAQHARDRADEEARTRADQANRQSALAAREQAREDQTRLTHLADQLKHELSDEQAALATLQQEQKAALDEQAFVLQFNAKAAVNIHDLEAVLTKLLAAPAAAPTPQPKTTSP